MNNSEKSQTLRWLRKIHEKFGQEIAVERKNGARLRLGDIIDDIIETVKGIPAAEDCHECKNCKYLETERDYDGRRRLICTKFDELVFDKNENQCLYGEKRIIDNDVAEQCPECSNLVWLKWDVERDGYTIYCPYCGYRVKLCSMCDVRDGGKCDWNSETGKCKNDKNGITTETSEPQPDGIQFRTVDDLGRICIPKDIRDKLGMKPGTECAVYATDELTSDEIIVIRREKNEKTP